MFQAWRLKLREAEEALRADRLDEAKEVLCRDNLREFFPAKRLMAKVAQKLAERGQARAQRGETSASWLDLESAAALGADHQTIFSLRELLVRQALREAEAYLAADDAASALERLNVVEKHHALTHDVRILKQVAGKLQEAIRSGREGKFTQAEATLAAAAALRPDLPRIPQLRQELQRRQHESRLLHEQLHQALAEETWSDVLSLADQLLELCPDDEIGRDARRRAWAAVGMALKDARPRGPATVAARGETPGKYGGTIPAAPRFLLWVDGVGGFLVCEAQEVLLGQPVAGHRVDVPILGDLSRGHAAIRRSGEGYLLLPRRPTKVEGKTVTTVATLNDGDLIELGQGVMLRFRRPHPLSSTARLDFVSHHRTQPPSDGVILMADSCILGPAFSSHVVCREWPGELVMFRREGELHARVPGRFEIDGVLHEGQGPLTRRSHITGSGFSVTLEEI
jgi:hypothetical protein